MAKKSKSKGISKEKEKSLEEELKKLGETYKNPQNSQQELNELREKYAKAEFILEKIAELRGMPPEEYIAKMRDEYTLNQFRESTYYEGNPTLATAILEDTIELIRARESIKEMARIYEEKIRAIINLNAQNVTEEQLQKMLNSPQGKPGGITNINIQNQ